MSDERNNGLRHQLLLLVGLALVVFGSRCAWVAAAGSNLPLWDQWHQFARLDGLAHGDLAALGALHNEHHVVTTRLVSTTLMLLSGYWDVKGELVVSAAVSAAEMLLLWVLLRPLLGSAPPGGLILLLVAVRALPLSPFNLLSGFQVQFAFVEIFSALGLALVATRRPLDAEGVAASTTAFLFAFLSMATGMVAVAAGFAVLVLQALSARGLERPRAAFALLLLCLCGTLYLLTPPLAVYAASGALQALHSLLACFSFPSQGSLPWLVLGHAPLALLTLQLVRRSRPEDPGWLVVALGLWTFLLSLAAAVGRGAMEVVPSARYFEFLALPLVWNYVALVRLLGLDRRPATSPTAWRRLATTAWAGCALLLLAGHVWARSWPVLEEAERVVPIEEARFRRSMASGDWRQQRLQLDYVGQWLRARDARFVSDPTFRFTIPNQDLLALGPRGPLRILPPALVSGRPPALPARFLEGLAAAWPWCTAVGWALLAVAWFRARASSARDSLAPPRDG